MPFTIRKWFLENNWELIEEEIIEEEGKIYEILVAEKGDPKRPYGMNLEMGLLFGPLFCKEKKQPSRKNGSMKRKIGSGFINSLKVLRQRQKQLKKNRSF